MTVRLAGNSVSGSCCVCTETVKDLLKMVVWGSYLERGLAEMVSSGPIFDAAMSFDKMINYIQRQP